MNSKTTDSRGHEDGYTYRSLTCKECGEQYTSTEMTVGDDEAYLMAKARVTKRRGKKDANKPDHHPARELFPRKGSPADDDRGGRPSGRSDD